VESPSRLDRFAIEHLRMRRRGSSTRVAAFKPFTAVTHLLILRCEGEARASKDPLRPIQP
jgi:hypothetical protein